MRVLPLIVGLLLMNIDVCAEQADSLHHYNYSLQVMPGRLVALDQYAERWIKKTPNLSLAAEIGRVALPNDSDAFASDFGYPSLTLGLRYTLNNQVRLHRDPDPAWGQAKEVDYNSRLGNTVSLYGKF